MISGTMEVMGEVNRKGEKLIFLKNGTVVVKSSKTFQVLRVETIRTEKKETVH